MYTNAALSLRRPLEGSLVEIHDLQQKLEPSPETRAKHPSAPAVDVNGERGRAIGWSEKDGKYIVETFDGVVLGVGEENLKEYYPPAPEDGGFDLAWPSGPLSHEEFAADLMANLDQKGYCFIQMFSNSRMREAAVEEASEMIDWRLPTKELEAAYLGYENKTKYVVLPQDNFAKTPESGIEQCDRILSNVGLLLRPMTQDFLGFTIDGRTNCNVCVPLANAAEEHLLRPADLSTGDDSEQKVHGHVNFLALRRVKLMYIVEAEGGEIVLQPSSSTGAGSASIPLSRNKLLVMLPDRLNYTYRPSVNSLLLQTWFMSQPPLTPDVFESRKTVEVPELQRAERVHFTSLCTRIPGSVSSRHGAWMMWISGTDCSVKVPSNRFDIDMYYNPEPYSGMLYVKHAATMMDYFMDNFDHAHFNISSEEAANMGPGQRNLTELGMECIYQSGYDKASMWGSNCGVYIGDKNTDRKSSVPSKIALEAANGIEMPTTGHSGFNSGVSASRLSYALNLKGPVTDIDTACSSALVAMGEAMRGLRRPKRGDLRPTAWTGLTQAVVMGMDLVDSCWTFFAYCAAQMVSIGGRSFTFDESANGFLRGDGVGSCMLELGKSDEEAQDMLACLMGTNVNQDGKSASLSAPHGPSQQQCIRASMQEAGLTASEITIAECHGTGTALGDPIEVGALRETMKKRECPLIMTSAKSNFGHTEAAAGICGIARCLVMLRAASGACNLHLKCINPHIEFMGYPALFINDAVDGGSKTGISGVSSFGVGGTNARGDIWARSVYGYRASDVVLPTRQLAYSNALHHRIRENGRPGPGASDELFLMGSWDNWSEMTEMENTAEGEWTVTLTPGDVRRERFKIILNRIPHMAFYPLRDQGDSNDEVFGPDWEGKDNSWVIDARADKAPAGSTYQIKFYWGFSFETGEYRRIEWERIDAPVGETPHVDGRTGEHSYWIAATWTSWSPTRMAASGGREGLYESTVRIGGSGIEEFQFLRDEDWKQVIYPAAAKAMKPSVPVRGPDDKGGDKAWVIRGAPGDVYTLQLQISDQAIVVRANSATAFVKKSWSTKDADDEGWHDYWVVGTFENQFTPMVPEQGGTKVFRCCVEIGEAGKEDFQISVDRDSERMLYPVFGGASSGESAVCGPDSAGGGLAWAIEGQPGAVYEVVLDWTQESNRILSWSEVAEARPAIAEHAEEEAADGEADS